MNIAIPEVSLQEWINALGVHQQECLQQILLHSRPEQAAQIWLSSLEPLNALPLDGPRAACRSWEDFSKELKRFLHDKRSYRKEKELLSTHGHPSGMQVLEVVAPAIAGKLGVAPSSLKPAIALELYCETHPSRKRSSPAFHSART